MSEKAQMKTGNSTTTKTWKREVAIALLIWFAYVVESKDAEIIEIIVWPVFTYSALAFGLQWFAPNGGLQRTTGFTNWGRPQYRSEYPSGEREYPNDRELDSTEIRGK